MVDRIPISFRRVPPVILEPFDSTEFATGRGIVELDAVSTSNSNILITEPIYAFATVLNQRGVNANIDADFDVDFERTVVLEGTAIVEFTSVIRRISGGPAATASTITVKLRHFDGTTETDLATGTDVLSATLADGAATFHQGSWSFTIAQTRFNVGDKLRLTLQATNNSAAWDVWILTDPKNREVSIGTFTSTDARCRVLIPIKK